MDTIVLKPGDSVPSFFKFSPQSVGYCHSGMIYKDDKDRWQLAYKRPGEDKYRQKALPRNGQTVYYETNLR